MRFTRIDVEGEKPGHYATMTRKQGSDLIEVEILTPGYVRTHQVVAASEDDQLSMAECLQDVLDGYPGTRGDIQPYLRAVQMLGDC